MDPIPPINRVFALVSQEEQQRQLTEIVGTSAQGASMVFALKNDQNRSNTGNRFRVYLFFNLMLKVFLKFL